MTLKTPQLDDRKFQDILDEARRRIPHYCEEWTDHNLSDPGITLLELFAWMVESLLYRLNQVPDLHYIKFMEMLGVRLREPVSAKVLVTFWLSAPQPTGVIIPAGTESASTQTETERSIVFTTDEDLHILPPELCAVISRVTAPDGEKKILHELNLRRLEVGFEGYEVFSTAPRVDDALYIGFENDLSFHLLGFEVDFDPAGGAGVDPTQSPYVWEASSGKEDAHWLPCEPELDTSRGMNSAGRIQIHLPKMGKHKIGEKNLYWVRVRVKEISPLEKQEGMRPYVKSPLLRKLSAASWGGTVPATHAQVIKREFLGRSDGSPGQCFHLQFPPVLDRHPGENLIVQVEGEPTQQWQEVESFARTGIGDHCYTLDGVSGELRLAPAVRQPDGTIKLFGAIPPRNSILLFSNYRYGGGQEGNVQKGFINTLKTSIPYIDRISNRQPAWGGLDAETLEAAMQRVPAMLYSRDRAVTEEDYEYLARQALPAAIGKVKCLQPRSQEGGEVIPGKVYLLVIPRLAHPEGFLQPEQLELPQADIATLTAFMDERRLLTTRLEIQAPAFQWVAIKVRLRPSPGVDPAKVENEVLARLYRYLNPLSGGAEETGWQFGRDLFISDVYQCLQGIPDVQFIRSVEVFKAAPGGDGRGDPIEQLEILPHGVVASGRHRVEMV
jgi:predicted phage baseplate assembly protein